MTDGMWRHAGPTVPPWLVDSAVESLRFQCRGDVRPWVPRVQQLLDAQSAAARQRQQEDQAEAEAAQAELEDPHERKRLRALADHHQAVKTLEGS